MCRFCIAHAVTSMCFAIVDCLQHEVLQSHWQTVDSMKLWVTGMVLPYYEATCQKLGVLPSQQHAILQIDMYPVHFSEDFTS